MIAIIIATSVIRPTPRYVMWAEGQRVGVSCLISVVGPAQVLDVARMKSALIICPYYVRTGGWIALAGRYSPPKPNTDPSLNICTHSYALSLHPRDSYVRAI